MLNLHNYGVLKIVMYYFFFSYCDPVEAAASLGINGTGVVTPTDCPRGHYCPASTPSSTTYPCPVGTFNNDTKLQAASSCLPCTAGFYCDAPGKNSLKIPVRYFQESVENTCIYKHVLYIWKNSGNSQNQIRKKRCLKSICNLFLYKNVRMKVFISE